MTPETSPPPRRLLLLGLGLTTFTTLLLELGLTRIYSVILWYHFAFMSVSLALFGLSAGGIIHFLFPEFVEGKSVPRRLAQLNAAFGLATSLLMVFLLSVRWQPSVSVAGMSQVAILYLASSIPFFMSGISTSMVLKHYSERVNTLYFIDLFGAALGCVLLIPLLDILGGIQVILLLGVLAALAGVCYGLLESRSAAMPAIAVGVVLLAGFVANGAGNVLQMRYIKGFRVADFFPEKPIFEGWNSFSRVAVMHWNDETYRGFSLDPLRNDPGKKPVLDMREYVSWGKSNAFQGTYPKQLNMVIDGAAGTMINRWDGNPASVPHLDYEITSIGYFTKAGTQPNVLIVGPGGGNDVMTALHFGASRVTAVELNPLIAHITRDVVADFTSGMFSRPEVNLTVDEGRSFIRRSPEKFDIIQASLIDTWAATAAGAYTLSENTLYTVEAFEDYLDHLKPNGIVTMSRYLFKPPRQTLRVASLACEALKRRGITDPSRHILIFRAGNAVGEVANLILRAEPFTDEEVRSIEMHVREIGFHIVYTPLTQENVFFNQVINNPNRDEFIANYPFDISACDDDRPFFFNQVRPRDWIGVLAFHKNVAKIGGEEGQSFNYDAVFILFALLSWATVLVLVFIGLPLLLRARSMAEAGWSTQLRWVTYFGSLGLGFMLVEISLLQKFVLFLGHPVYALAVILFSILLSSSIGSWLSGRFATETLHQRVAMVIGGIAVVSTLHVLLLPTLFGTLMPLHTPYKIVITVLLLFPLGLLMGMPFPSGLRLLRTYSIDYLPWAWGINGATSVLGSIVAFAFALSFGYTRTLQVGQLVYLAGLIAVLFLPARDEA